MNLFILKHGSIQLNTFPSAHVASTAAVSLVLIHLVPAVGLVFLLISASIALGAVVGRYHYALDVIFGAALSLGIYCLIG
jgi:membrane-associated phospholipid phosphatase